MMSTTNIIFFVWEMAIVLKNSGFGNSIQRVLMITSLGVGNAGSGVVERVVRVEYGIWFIMWRMIWTGKNGDRVSTDKKLTGKLCHYIMCMCLFLIAITCIMCMRIWQVIVKYLRRAPNAVLRAGCFRACKVDTIYILNPNSLFE